MTPSYHIHPFLVLLTILCCCTQGLLSDCPRLCECKWKNGKESVTCIKANYSIVPQDLDSGTQILDLSANNLMRLKEDVFSKVGLVNLQRVYLIKCRLKLIDRYAFRNLINLVELDLSQNYLYTVPDYIFHSMPELRELKINTNPISRLPNRSFIHVPKIVRIEFSNCKIGIIEDLAFEGIQNSLQWLKLDGNQLSEVKASSFTSLGTIHGLELSGNPWNCTCNLRPFYEWMIQKNIPFEAPPTCKTPKRLASKSWRGLELDEFACVPHIKAPETRTHSVEGSNITISCMINGIPEPNIRWLLKNRVIANQTNVSYSSGKKQYVVNNKYNSSNLTIQMAEVQDAGVYICSAENKAGKVEASVMLVVSRKISENLSENKAVVAGIVIAVVFVSLATFLIVCVCSVRRRRQGLRWQGRRTSSRSRDEDNYEKIEMSKLTNENASNDAPVASVAIEISSIHPPVKRNGEYRVVPNMDTDHELEEEDASYEDNLETPTPTNADRSRDTKLWTAAATGRSISSPNSGHWNSNVCDSNLDPDDLHIPRRTKEQTRGGTSKIPNSIYGTYKDSGVSDISHISDKPHRILPNIPQSIHPAIMTKHVLPSNGSLYSSVPVPSELNARGLANPNFEGIADFSDNVACDYQQFVEDREITSKRFLNDVIEGTADNLYCTLPRQKITYGKSGTRYRSCDSESPLLSRSRYSSSGGDSSSESRVSSRRFSEDSLKYSQRTNYSSNLNQRSSSYLSLTSSRQHLFVSNKSSSEVTPPDSTPLLNVGALEENLISPSSNFSVPLSSRRSPFNDRALQLERFLEGYRNVHHQLSTMKEMCDQIKQQREEEKQLRTGLFYDPLLLPEYEDSNPKSILKKPVSTVSSSMFNSLDLPSAPIDWTLGRNNLHDSNKKYY